MKKSFCLLVVDVIRNGRKGWGRSNCLKEGELCEGSEKVFGGLSVFKEIRAIVLGVSGGLCVFGVV